MDINGILLGVLLVLASALCAVGIWALIEAVKTARSTKTLADDVDLRMVPLLEKADVTIDALNIELLRIDTIVTRIEEVTDRVESTSRTVQGVANAPGEIVTDIADRVRRAWKRRQAETAATGGAHRAEPAGDGGAPRASEASEPPDAPEPPARPTIVPEPPEYADPETDITATDETPV